MLSVIGKVLKKLALAATATVIVLELMLRPFAGNFAMNSIHAFHLPDGRCVGLKPDLRVEYTGWGKRISASVLDSNSQGFRGPEVSAGADPDVFRIAMLGDSIVYGQGVTWGEALPRALEAELRGAVPQRRVQVLNFGVSALNLADYPEQITRFAVRWAPDLLLVVVIENDLFAPYCEEADTPEFARTVLPSILTLRVAWLLAFMGATMVSLAFDDDGFVERQGRLREQVAAVQRAATATEVPLVLVYMGDPVMLWADKPGPDRVADVMAEFDIPWLDGRSWRTDDEPPLEAIPWEGHLTPAGNREAARRIAEWLRPQVR